MKNINIIYDEDMRENIKREDHVGILLKEPIDYMKTNMPVKFFDYLEAGIPVVAYESTKLGDIVEEYGLGWTVARSVRGIYEFARRSYLDIENFEDNRRKFLYDNTWKDRVAKIRGVSKQ
mgnify:CR=1 FL=1